MASNSTEVTYGFGQMGSIHVAGTTAITCTGISASPLSVPDNVVFVAITFLEDTVFNSDAEGLIPETSGLFPSSNAGGHLVDLNGGVATDGEVFPRGVTIYGRWTGFKLLSGRVIAYVGY